MDIIDETQLANLDNFKENKKQNKVGCIGPFTFRLTYINIRYSKCKKKNQRNLIIII